MGPAQSIKRVKNVEAMEEMKNMENMEDVESMLLTQLALIQIERLIREMPREAINRLIVGLEVAQGAAAGIFGEDDPGIRCGASRLAKTKLMLFLKEQLAKYDDHRAPTTPTTPTMPTAPTMSTAPALPIVPEDSS